MSLLLSFCHGRYQSGICLAYWSAKLKLPVAAVTRPGPPAGLGSAEGYLEDRRDQYLSVLTTSQWPIPSGSSVLTI